MRNVLLIGIAALALAASARADDQAVIDISGVQIANGVNQARNSGADTISPAFVYSYQITGTARGTSGVLALLFPTATPLSTIFETLAPGSAAQLGGVVYNQTGAHPAVLLNNTFAGSGDVGGITATSSIDVTAGVNASDAAYFNLANVVMQPSTGIIRLGALQVVSGSVTIRRVGVLLGDMNGDALVNNFDIDAFVLAVIDPAAYQTMYQRDPRIAGDVNRDGLFNNFDIDPFVAIIIGP